MITPIVILMLNICEQHGVFSCCIHIRGSEQQIQSINVCVLGCDMCMINGMPGLCITINKRH